MLKESELPEDAEMYECEDCTSDVCSRCVMGVERILCADCVGDDENEREHLEYEE